MSYAVSRRQRRSCQVFSASRRYAQRCVHHFTSIQILDLVLLQVLVRVVHSPRQDLSHTSPNRSRVVLKHQTVRVAQDPVAVVQVEQASAIPTFTRHAISSSTPSLTLRSRRCLILIVTRPIHQALAVEPQFLHRHEHLLFIREVPPAKPSIDFYSPVPERRFTTLIASSTCPAGY